MKKMSLFTSGSTKYLLMNKNVTLGEVDLWDGSPKKFSIPIYGFKTFPEWVSSRTKILCRKDAEDFLADLGMDTKDALIEVTHCVSLHDSLWVKRLDEDLSWEDVSPFRVDYSEVVSTYTLEGLKIGQNGDTYFSPVIGTDGSFPHSWKMAEEGVKFLKAGSAYTNPSMYAGREPYSEYYASVIGRSLGINCVDYTIRNYLRWDGKLDVITECNCFTTEEVGSVTARKLGITSYSDLIEYAKELGEVSYNTVLDMLFLDCLLLNTDRHFENIEFLMDNDTHEILSVAPIFDNNLSMLPNFVEECEEFDRSRLKTRTGISFEDLYMMVCRHKDYYWVLQKAYDIELKSPPNGVSISPGRLKFLNWFLREQISYLVKLGYS